MRYIKNGYITAKIDKDHCIVITSFKTIDHHSIDKTGANFFEKNEYDNLEEITKEDYNRELIRVMKILSK